MRGIVGKAVEVVDDARGRFGLAALATRAQATSTTLIASSRPQSRIRWKWCCTVVNGGKSLGS